MRFSLQDKPEFLTQDLGKTRKAREDTIPHERSSTPVLPFEFSSIALADRKIRYRRELPASRSNINSSPA